MSIDKTLAKHQLEPGELTYALKQAILSDLLEIIGEDETLPSGENVNGMKSMKRRWRNQSRQELREKIKAYCGGDK